MDLGAAAHRARRPSGDSRERRLDSWSQPAESAPIASTRSIAGAPMPAALSCSARAARSQPLDLVDAPGTPRQAAPRRRRAAGAAPCSTRRSETRTRTSLGPEPEGAHDVDRQRDDLGVGQRPRLADQVAVELEVLSKPPPLLPLVAEQLGDGEPADRLPEPVGPGRHHPRQGRRHLRAQRDLASALVGEVVELPHDLVAALRRVQLQRLERRAVVLLEPVAGRNRPPGPEDVGPEGEIGGIEIAKARQGLGLHGENISR